MRSVPDLVSNADPRSGVMICQASAGGCPSGLVYGGTSLTAPMMAGLTAIMNAEPRAQPRVPEPGAYPLAGTSAFEGPAALGSDFAHVGLGSANVDQLLIHLGERAVGLPDPYALFVSPGEETTAILSRRAPYRIPANGTAEALVRVTLVDEGRNPVAGKTVTLAANPPGNIVVTPASGVSDLHGAVVFKARNLVAEDVTFTATDTTDEIELQHARGALRWSARGGGSIHGVPTTVKADGIAATTITVTLRDALDRPAVGEAGPARPGRRALARDRPEPERHGRHRHDPVHGRELRERVNSPTRRSTSPTTTCPCRAAPS